MISRAGGGSRAIGDSLTLATAGTEVVISILSRDIYANLVRFCIRVNTYMYCSLHICMYEDMYIFACVFDANLVWVCIHVYTYMYCSLYICMYEDMYIFVDMCMFVCVFRRYVYIRVCIRVHM